VLAAVCSNPRLILLPCLHRLHPRCATWSMRSARYLVQCCPPRAIERIRCNAVPGSCAPSQPCRFGTSIRWGCTPACNSASPSRCAHYPGRLVCAGDTWSGTYIGARCLVHASCGAVHPVSTRIGPWAPHLPPPGASIALRSATCGVFSSVSVAAQCLVCTSCCIVYTVKSRPGWLVS
jgi:hypothetical protein